MMPFTFHSLIFPVKKCINLATVLGLLKIAKVFKESKIRNFSGVLRDFTAWSIATLMSLNFSGLPMYKQFSTFFDSVLEEASMKIISLVSMLLLARLLCIIS